MQRDGEDVARMSAAHDGLSAEYGWPAGWQRFTHSTCSRKYRCGSVAVMNVAIDGHGSPDFAIALHAANGDRDVVNHAKAFAVIRKGVVKSAADVDRDSIVQCILRSKNRTAGSEPESLHQFRRERNFKLKFFTGGESSSLQLLDILRRMDQQDVLIGSWLRCNEVFRPGNTAFDQLIMHTTIFLRRKNMLPDG